MKKKLSIGLAALAGVVTLVGVGVNAKAALARFIPGVLLFDIAVIAVAGVVLVSMQEVVSHKWMRRIPLMVSGALLGATAISPVLVAPWVLAGALGFGILTALREGVEKRKLVFSGFLILSAACLNFFALWFCTMSEIKPGSPEEFRSKPFRVHGFLSDVELHDVWVAQLRGGGDGKTIQDVRQVMSANDTRYENTMVVGLITFRILLGKVFGWDEERHFDEKNSYANRLTEEDKALSASKPNQKGGHFRVIYDFEQEILSEIVNETVHAFFVMAMEPSEGGYTLYLAIYVKPIGKITSRYMGLIDPFRRLFIYPAMVKRLESSWARKYGAHHRVVTSP